MNQELCYREQLKLYREIFDIGVAQEKAIREKDYKRLIFLIKEKGKIMSRIDALKENSPLTKEPDEKTERLIKEITDILRKILEQEKKNHSLLKSDIKEVSEKIDRIDAARNFHQAYRKMYSPVKPRFLDQRR